MSFLSLVASSQDTGTGSGIGTSYTLSTASDQTNRETHEIAAGSEVNFLFTPVPAGSASILCVRFLGLVDAGTGDAGTLVTWGYTTGTATHDHTLGLGESHLVRLNPAKAATGIFIACPLANATAVYVESQVWQV